MGDPSNLTCTMFQKFITQSLDEIKERFSEIKELISKGDVSHSEKTDKLSCKISKLEDLFHSIDKEMYKVRTISDVVEKQSRLNTNFFGSFESIEKRLKIIFSVIFVGFAGVVTLLFIFIKSLIGVE